MEHIKKHFNDEAHIFDEVIIKLIPYYREMVDALVSSFPFKLNDSFKAVDLGCGTGAVAFELKKRFPKAQILCVDFAENMIKLAKSNLGQYKDVEYKVSDFAGLDFKCKYDLVISSLALHHIPSDNEKKDFYGRIYNCLSQGGGFYNADVVLGSSDELQQMYMDKWRQFMLKKVTPEEVKKTDEKYHREDSPTKLIDQLSWLKDIGFKSVDVIWKYYNFAVYGGKR